LRFALTFALVFVSLAFGPIAAFAQPAPAGPPATALPEPTAMVEANYVLGLGDVVEVSVVGRTDFQGRVRVGPDGNILLPLIGSIQAVNLRPADLATQIRAALEKGGFYSQPVVRVEVVTVASRFVTVLGQVGSPGLVPLDRSYRLSEILAKVGAKITSGSDYVIVTRGEAGTQQRFAMAEIATGGTAKDPFVSPGDKIYVPAAESEIYYLSGAVKSPGIFPLMAGMTVRMAIARGGGVTEMGNENKVQIFRKGVKVPKVTLETPVEEGDIIKLGERMF
jgi:polysaccharide export outer membrane protein